jgi:hypothetical protein
LMCLVHHGDTFKIVIRCVGTRFFTDDHRRRVNYERADRPPSHS